MKIFLYILFVCWLAGLITFIIEAFRSPFKED